MERSELVERSDEVLRQGNDPFAVTPFQIRALELLTLILALLTEVRRDMT
jgi:hypothetical protein